MLTRHMQHTQGARYMNHNFAKLDLDLRQKMMRIGSFLFSFLWHKNPDLVVGFMTQFIHCVRTTINMMCSPHNILLILHRFYQISWCVYLIKLGQIILFYSGWNRVVGALDGTTWGRQRGTNPPCGTKITTSKGLWLTHDYHLCITLPLWNLFANKLNA